MPPVNYHYGQFPPKNLDWLRLAAARRILGEIRYVLLDNLEGRQVFEWLTFERQPPIVAYR